MLRTTLLSALPLLCPLIPAASQQPGTGRELHLGAHVQVKVPKIAPDWIEGTVVGAQGSATCFAVRLNHTDAQGRQQYAFLRAVTELQVDRRTNEGILTVGLPPATEADWETWSETDVDSAVSRCKR